MAEFQPEQYLSLIPYASPGEVVLRHGDAIITLDPQSRQLILRDVREDSIQSDRCPYCHRPFQDDNTNFDRERRHQSHSTTRHGFVNPEYFQLLADRTPVSALPTRASTPNRHARALRSGQSRNVSSSEPPSGAEFVGSTPAPSNADSEIKSSSFAPGYFKRFFVEKGVLGKGGRGVVLLVEHVLDGVDCGDFACKRIPVGNDHDWLTKVLVEVQLLQRLHHPNLVAYQHVWLEDAQTTRFGPSVPCVYILQQLCNSGDLHEYVQKATAKLPERLPKTRSDSLTSLRTQAPEQAYLSFDEIFSFFRDIVSGIDHLHHNGYIHRDLKPSNCLLHKDGQKMKVLVSDFGEVQVATAQRSSTGATGTISYCAPEVLTRESPDGSYGNFTIKSDVFSLGMILHYMCFSTLPYVNADIKEENEDMDLLRAEITSWHGFGESARKRKDLPDKLYKFLEQLLHVDPAKRPTTGEILHSLRHGIDLRGGAGGRKFEVIDDGTSSGEDRRGHFGPQSQRFYKRRVSGHESNKVQNTPSPRSDRRRGSQYEIIPDNIETDQDGSLRGTSDSAAMTSDSSALPSPRRRLSVRHRRNTNTQTHETIEQERRPSLLLLPPPPPRRRRLSFLPWWNLDPRAEQILRVGLFAVKMVSLILGCHPFTTDPAVTLSLVGVAALDLVLTSAPLAWSLLLCAGHFLAVFALSRTGHLCARSALEGRWASTAPMAAGGPGAIPRVDL